MAIRRAFKDTQLYSNDDGEFLGVNLGWDFTSEHEWGIDKLRAMLGMPEISTDGKWHQRKKYGADLRRIAKKKVPYCVRLFKSGKASAILCSDKALSYGNDVDLGLLMKQRNYPFDEISFVRDEDIVAGWCEHSFLVIVRGEEAKYLETLHEEMLKGNVIVCMQGSENPFARNGLCLLIEDRLSQDILDTMRDGDIEYENLQKDADATGIKAKLEKFGKKFFALSPKRPFVDNGDGTYTPFRSSTNEETNVTTKYNVMFWLNPMQQDENNTGWFTVEQLEEWCLDKGPVPKKAEEVHNA